MIGDERFDAYPQYTIRFVPDHTAGADILGLCAGEWPRIAAISIYPIVHFARLKLRTWVDGNPSSYRDNQHGLIA